MLIDDWNINNFGLGSGVASLIKAKHSTSDFTIRRIMAYDNYIPASSSLYGIIMVDDISHVGYQDENVEICYNNISPVSSTRFLGAVPEARGDIGPLFWFRNTGYNGQFVLQTDMPMTIKGNIYSSVSGFTNADDLTIINDYPLVSTSYFKADRTLTDQYLIDESIDRGIRGHEIK